VKEVTDMIRSRFMSFLLADEHGSEITEQVFWIGLVILAIVLLLPQLRGSLISNLQSLISALGS
jgi:hypothetical protein